VTALTVAGLDCDLVHEIQQLIHNHYCCTYCCTDLIGVQCGGAFKNILALGLGILDGSGYTDNTKAFVFTRGLYEMAICAQTLGGKRETLYGLSGVGDLMLTCMGRLSRNTYLGQCLGKGKSIDEGTKELGTIPEGMNTIESVYQLAQRNKLDLPVCAGIRAMVLKSMNVQEFLEDIIAHHAAAECL
jgi:glycerol-3-phosphate dehydrogenase (NAD(P)+)